MLLKLTSLKLMESGMPLGAKLYARTDYIILYHHSTNSPEVKVLAFMSAIVYPRALMATTVMV